MIETKDVVLAALGAAAALGGFVLVFLGIVIASFQSYAGNAPPSVVRPFRIAGVALFATFGLSIATVTLCLLWLVLGGASGLYAPALAFFFLQLVAVVLSAGWATRMVMWP